MSEMACQITGISTICSIVCSCADQRKHQRSESLAFVRGIHRWPVDSPHKGPVPRKMFPLDYNMINPGVHMWAVITRLHMIRYSIQQINVYELATDTPPPPTHHHHHHHLTSLYYEFFGDVTDAKRWIPLIKGQQRGTHFYVMTS